MAISSSTINKRIDTTLPSIHAALILNLTEGDDDRDERHLSMRTYILYVLLAVLLPMTSSSLPAEDLVIGEQTYRNGVIKSVTLTHVTILHKGGFTQIPLSKLPDEWKERLKYDPIDENNQIQAIAEERRQRILENDLQQQKKPSTSSKPTPPVDLTRIQSTRTFPIKNQGKHPTNAIYSVVSALQYEYSKKAPPTQLSENFLIWALGEIDPAIGNNIGFPFAKILIALQTYGISQYSLMPNKTGDPIASIQKPKADILNDASVRKNVQPIWFEGTSGEVIHHIINTLNSNSPVVLTLKWPPNSPQSNSHYLDEQTTKNNQSHAVTLIGYERDSKNPETIRFLFRNSFGPRWGYGGYGYVTLSYLKKNLQFAFRIEVL